MAVTENVWRSTCGVTGRRMRTRLATYLTKTWMVRGRHAHGVVRGEMPLQEGLDASRQGNDAPLGLGAVRTALAVDHEAVTLPINVVFGERRQL
jgi:hypothetical protein